MCAAFLCPLSLAVSKIKWNGVQNPNSTTLSRRCAGRVGAWLHRSVAVDTEVPSLSLASPSEKGGKERELDKNFPRVSVAFSFSKFSSLGGGG